MDTPARLLFLGAPRAEYAGQPIQSFESRKALALLGYLAVRSDSIPRSQFAALFWPDQPDERGRGNLRHLLHNLTTLLPGCLNVDRHNVQLHNCWTDLSAFDALLAQGTLAALTEAAELYRGPFLDGLYLDDCPDVETWLLQERERWHERVGHVLADLAVRSREQREWEAGLRWVDRLLALDPWREAAHQEKMRLLALSGRRDSALAQYEICRRILVDELGIDPSPETSALYDQIRDGALAAPAAPLPQRFQVPLHPTALLGRADELAQVMQLLAQPTCRLLTLLGPGGVGKTRLALEVVTQQQALFNAGACVVELAAIRDPALVATAIAQSLGIIQSNDRSALESLKTWLHDKQLLLYLDNFEQILDAAALVSDLLASAAQLKIIVTSRIPLRLRVEQEFSVGPLALPPPTTNKEQRIKNNREPRTENQRSTTDNAILSPLSSALSPTDVTAVLAHYAATALFVERAHSVNPGFAVTNATAPVITEICVRLDGLPLAIELAAARSKLFPPAALLTRLEHRLPFLTSTMRDRPAHQQTIRNTIAWSYHLLDAHEQTLFARLSVFVGGWTLELAEAIVVLDAALQLDIVEGMAALVDHSMVRQHGSEGETRFTMLETIHEYALEQLQSSADYEQIRQRHASAVCALAEQHRQLLYGPQELAGLAGLEREHDNLRAALAFAIQKRDTDLASRLAGALWPFWNIRGHYAEGLQWLMQVRAVAGNIATDAYLHVLDGSHVLASTQGSDEQANALADELLALARASEDARWMGRALMNVATRQATKHQMIAYYEEALALFKQVDDMRLSANALLNIGRTIALDQHDYMRAAPFLEQSLALDQQRGNQTGSIHALLHLGLIRMRSGNLRMALEQYQAALQLAWAARNKLMIAYCFDALAGTAGLSGLTHHAAQLFGVAEARRNRLGISRSEQEQALYEQWVAVVRAQLGDAPFERLWATGYAMRQDQAISFAAAVTSEEE